MKGGEKDALTGKGEKKAYLIPESWEDEGTEEIVNARRAGKQQNRGGGQKSP